MTSKRMRMMLVYGWVHSVFWAAGPLVGWGDYTSDPHTNTCRPNWAADETIQKSYVVLLGIFGFLLPVLIMIFCYAKIFSIVEKHVKDIEKMSCSAASMESISHLDSSFPQPTEPRRKSDLRAHNMILVIIVVFFACWLPYSIIAMKKVFLEGTSGSYWSINGGLTLALLTTAVNPLIYAMRDRRFKRGFQKFFCGLRNIYDPDNALPLHD